MRSWSRADAPAVPAALALAFGIALGVLLPWVPRGWLLSLVVTGLAAFWIGWTRRSRLLLVAGIPVTLLGVGLEFGAHRVLSPRASFASSVARIPEDTIVEVVGRLRGFWTASGATRRVELVPDSARGAGLSLARTAPLLLTVSGARDPRTVADVGDLVRVRGRVRLPEGRGFWLPPAPRLALKSADQIEVLAGPAGPRGIFERLHRAAFSRLRQGLATLTPEELRPASLLVALLLGETADLPVDVSSAFRDGGIAHVLAISGSHVALLAFLIGALANLSPLPLSIATRDLLVLFSTLAFALLVGGQPPVTRAASMIAVYLIGRLVGRPTSPAQVTFLTALLLLLWEPASLFDVGFLLTFAAVGGLFGFGVPAARLLARLGMPQAVAGAVGATFGAELSVLPVQASVFRVVPFVSLVTNLLVVPLVAVFLVVGLFVSPLLAIGDAPARFAMWPLAVLYDGILGMLSFFDRAAAIRLVPAPSPFLIAVLVSCLALAARPAAWGSPRFRMTKEGTSRFAASVPRIAFLAALILSASIVFAPNRLAAKGTVRLLGLDVGQGDSWLLTSETGSVLVDGGGSFDATYEFGRLRLLPALSDAGAVAFEAVVLTHPHPDHARGLLPVLAIASVGRLAIPRGSLRNDVLDEVLEVAARRSLPVARLGLGDRLEAAGFVFEVLHPGPESYPRARENNGSLVLKTRLGERTALLTGDVEALAEQDLLSRGVPLSADILKVAHHGSRTSTSDALLSAVGPRLALIGVGRHNRFGHPNGEVLERLAAHRARALRTDRDGEISIVIRGRTVQPSWEDGLR